MPDYKTKHRYVDYAGMGCPVEASLELFGGKGKGMILYHLLERTHRFNELKRKLGTISQRMLTKQLRELEACGIVHREVYPEVPPRVEYSLTETGETLRPVIMGLKEWGLDYALPILKKR